MIDEHISGNKMEIIGFRLCAWASAIDTFLVLFVIFPLKKNPITLFK